MSIKIKDMTQHKVWPWQAVRHLVLRALTMTLALEGEPTWLKRQPQAG